MLTTAAPIFDRWQAIVVQSIDKILGKPLALVGPMEVLWAIIMVGHDHDRMESMPLNVGRMNLNKAVPVVDHEN